MELRAEHNTGNRVQFSKANLLVDVIMILKPMLRESTIFTYLALALWFIALPESISYAQSLNPANKIKFEHLHEGLSESTVTCMLQDRKGFIWCGTRNGLNKYNGAEFTLYETIDGDSTSLSQNQITSIYQDSKGNIWVGTLEGGLNLYNSKKDAFSHFRHAPNNPSSLSDNSVFTIYEDVTHNLWVGTANGLNLFSSTKKSFIQYKYEQKNTGSLSNNLVRTIFEDKQLNLWIGTNGGGLDRFNPKTKSFKHHTCNKFRSGAISNNFIRCSYKDSKGRVWLGTQEGLNLLIETKGDAIFKQFKRTAKLPINLSNNTILSLSEDCFGRIWIGSQTNGLSLYDEKVNQFTDFYPNPLDPSSISSNSIWSILKDNAGTMWLGVRNRGLDKWDQSHQQFGRYDIDPSAANTLSNKDVTCFSEDSLKNLWIGTDGGGLTYFDRKANKFIHFVSNPLDKRSLSSNSVISLLEERSNKLWIGTWGGGLNVYNKKTKTFKRFMFDAADPSSISGNNIYTMLKDRAGKLWIGTYGNGINLFDPKTETFYRPLHNQKEEVPLNKLNRVLKIFEDSKNNIWIGTEGGGLELLNWRGKGNFSYTRYKNDPTNSESLSSDVVNTIMEDRRHNLWIGTRNGVNQFNYKHKTFKTYRKKDGLPDNVISGILEDDSGYIWFSTNHGLSRFDLKAKKFKNFTTGDGLAAQEFLRGAYLKSKTGEFFFGSIDGFNAFTPQKIHPVPNTSITYLTEFKINNKAINPGQINSPLQNHINETNELVLTYDQNNFSIGFVSLNYSQASKINYSCILEGYDNHWQSTANRRQVTYSKVPPGTYIFRVRGFLISESQYGKTTSLKIIINPPYWNTWWAYLLYLLLVTIVICWYKQTLSKQFHLKNRLALEQLEISKMQEMEKLKSNYFINISHEFRMPLTLILNPLKDMYAGNFNGECKAQYQVMIRNAERLLKLINQLLDLSKLNSGHMKIKASNADLIHFLKPILLSFESLAQKKSIQYSFNFPQYPVNLYFDPDKLEKVVINLLSNAFKFTNSGEIKLSVKSIDSDTLLQTGPAYVEICVTDTGSGIPQDRLNLIFDYFYQIAYNVNYADMQGSGIGLSLTKELVELHSGKILVKSTEGKGTTFSVLLPLGKGHLKASEIVEEEPISNNQNKCLHNLERLEVIQSDAQYECHSVETDLPLILLVEDNDDMRAYLRGNLEKNFNIIEAIDGKQGLKKAVENTPDIIISDVLMSKMDGIEMCKLLKTNSATLHIPIILLTAQADSGSKINGLANGADDYIAKPFDSQELEVRVNNLIKLRETVRQKFTKSKNLVLEPNEVTITPFDEIFLKKVLESIEKNISDPEYRVDDLGSDISMGRMPLYRKIKALTGQTAVEFIRTIRLRRAAQLLKQHQLTVSEVTYEVGFNDLQYFRLCFKKQFGMSPSVYARMVSDGIENSSDTPSLLSVTT